MSKRDFRKKIKIYNRRSFFLIIFKLILFSIIGFRLFNIQIFNSKKYKTLSKNNQIKIDIIYPLRGRIKDRNNILIATNDKSYDLYIVPEKVENINFTLNALNEYISINFKIRRKIIDLSKKVKKFERIKVISSINWKDLEVIEVNKNNLPGLYLQNAAKRVYPFGFSFSHILGYINKPSEEDLNLPFISRMPALEIGRTGLEKYFNSSLIGKPGKREIEVNAKGREIREISNIRSIKGEDVNISIDSRIQEFALKQLKKFKAGSIVLLNSNSGEVIAMISSPNYDPNQIIQKPNQKYWKSILENQLGPLTNRSVQGLYSPGSTFKMIVALAALKMGVVNLNDFEDCEGKIEYGDRLYHCWKTLGHGEMNLIEAIKQSCDVFFYKLSLKVGVDKIALMAREFGLGTKFNFGFENEQKGIIPSKKWKKENLNTSWYSGETLNTAIGQGYVLTSPLQLAIMTSRIASNGKKIKPTFKISNNTNVFEKIKIQDNHMKIIKDAMFKAVNEQMGTAFKSRSDEYSFSGKTGTSQVKKISIEERESKDFRKKEKEWKNKDHALFVGYMPTEKPKYAITVIIEHGGSGASVAAPIAKNIFDFVHKLEKN